MTLKIKYVQLQFCFLNHHVVLLSVILLLEIKHNMSDVWGINQAAFNWIHWFSPSLYLLRSKPVNLNSHILFRNDGSQRYWKIAGSFESFPKKILVCSILAHFCGIHLELDNLSHLLVVWIILFFIALLN